MNKIKFPTSFEVKPHDCIPFAKQWLYKNESITISIVGGGKGLYGDGINTFEYWDFSQKNPIPYLTKRSINARLRKYNINQK